MSAPFWGTAALLAAAVALGGAARDNGLLIAAVELLSLPVLAFSCWHIARHGLPRETRAPLAIAAAAVGLLLLQLLPLPRDLWSRLPGRKDVDQALTLTGGGRSWRPLSLSPE